MTPRYALRCFGAGAGIGCVIIAGFAARTLLAMGMEGRMPDLYRLMGWKYH